MERARLISRSQTSPFQRTVHRAEYTWIESERSEKCERNVFEGPDEDEVDLLAPKNEVYFALKQRSRDAERNAIISGQSISNRLIPSSDNPQLALGA